MDLGQARLIKDKSFSFGTQSVDQAIGNTAGEQVSLVVKGQAHDVCFLRIEENVALSGALHPENLALVAGAHVQASVGIKSESPDVFCLRVVELGGLAVGAHPVDLAFRRTGRVKRVVRTYRQGENIRFVRRKEEGAFTTGVDAKHLPLMTRAHVEIAAIITRQ